MAGKVSGHLILYYLNYGTYQLFTLHKSQVCRFETPLDSLGAFPGRNINERCFGGFPMVLLQLKDPLELFEKRR